MAASRRDFLIRSSLAVAGGALFPGLKPRAEEPKGAFESLRGGVGLFTERGGTIGWLIRPDLLVVVDSQFPESAGRCLEGIRMRSERKIDALINTHHHRDHTGGNGVFEPAATMIVAHEKVPVLQKQAAEKRDTVAEQTLASVTFKTDWSLEAGAETVTATHRGPAHTGGDCVVHFQNANVAHMGDLVFNRYYPFIDRPAGASIGNWIGVLEQVVAAHDDETLYIFGHGNPEFGVTGSSADLLRKRDYLSALLEFTGKGIRQGKSLAELEKTETLPGFPDFKAPSDWLTLGANIKVAHEELSEDSST